MSDPNRLTTAEKRNRFRSDPIYTAVSSKTVARKAEQAITDEKEHKVYRNWANWILRGANIDFKIESFRTDLSDGVALNLLCEAFSGRAQRYTKKCANEFQKIDNINMALAWFKRKGLNYTVNSQDFLKGDLRGILAFFWMLIQKYQLVSTVDMSFGGNKAHENESIYDWVRRYVGEYPGISELRIESPQAFRDGRLLSYMVHKSAPDSIDVEAVPRNSAKANLDKAITEAYDQLGVPLLMESDDLLEPNPHEPTLLTYLYAFKASVENDKHMSKRKEDIERAASERRNLEAAASNMREVQEEAEAARLALEAERERIRQLEEQRRAEAEALRLADEAKRAKEAEKMSAELEKLRREKFDMLTAQREADKARKEQEAETARLLAEMRQLKEEREEAERAERERREREAATARAVSDADAERARLLAEMQKLRDAQADADRRHHEEAEEARKALAAAQAERDRLEREAEEERDRLNTQRSMDSDDADRRAREAERAAEDARRRLAEEARLREEAEAARRRAEEEAARRKREAEEAEDARRRAQEDAARRKREAEEARRNQQRAEDEAEAERRRREQEANEVRQRFAAQQATRAQMDIDCYGCGEKLRGLVVRVDHKELYHETCFQCTTCSCSFQEYYYPFEGKPYCQEHFLEASGMRCAACSQLITDGSSVKARGGMYHAACFSCHTCHKQFDGKYYYYSGHPYCADHYHAASGNVCAACEGPVHSDVLKAFGKRWHRNCWSCFECKKALAPAGGRPLPFFKASNGRPICEECRSEQQGTLTTTTSSTTITTSDGTRSTSNGCSRCSEPLEDDIVSAMGRMWHGACFTCEKCNASFGNGTFFNVNGEPRCIEHKK